MKIARYLAHGQISYGMVEGNAVKELSASPYEVYEVTEANEQGVSFHATSTMFL